MLHRDLTGADLHISKLHAATHLPTGTDPLPLIPGPQGLQGEIGATGATGAAGADSTVAGPQGDTGITGTTGAAGANGDTGSQGIQGIQGSTGATGAAGTTTWTGITDKPSTFAPPTHADTHAAAGTDPLVLAESQVTDLTAHLDSFVQISTFDIDVGSLFSAIDGKAPTVHAHVKADITDFPALVEGPAGPTGAAGAAGADSTVPGPTGPTGSQGIQGIKGDTGSTGATGADSTVPGPQGDTGDTGAAGTTTWAGITDKPATFTPTAHNQALATITDVTATAAELNQLNGILPTVTELNFVDGVTSAIQTQLNAKVASATISAAGAELINDANAAAQRATLGTAAYSEGTWTPTLNSWTIVGAAPVVTGTYKRIGNLVFVICKIAAGVGGNTTVACGGGGASTVNGLPFSAVGAAICLCSSDSAANYGTGVMATTTLYPPSIPAGGIPLYISVTYNA